jgi:hypothetical protein
MDAQKFIKNGCSVMTGYIVISKILSILFLVLIFKLRLFVKEGEYEGQQAVASILINLIDSF